MLEIFNRWIRNLTRLKSKEHSNISWWKKRTSTRREFKAKNGVYNKNAAISFETRALIGCCFWVDQSEDALQMAGLRHAWGPWYFVHKRLRRFSNVLEKHNSWIFSCWTESGNFQKQIVENVNNRRHMHQKHLTIIQKTKIVHYFAEVLWNQNWSKKNDNRNEIEKNRSMRTGTRWQLINTTFLVRGKNIISYFLISRVSGGVLEQLFKIDRRVESENPFFYFN